MIVLWEHQNIRRANPSMNLDLEEYFRFIIESRSENEFIRFTIVAQSTSRNLSIKCFEFGAIVTLIVRTSLFRCLIDHWIVQHFVISLTIKKRTPSSGCNH